MATFFISADLEGVCGVVSPVQCYPTTDRGGYQEAVAQLAHEVNAVADAIWAHDATAEVVVNDAHDRMTNLPQRLLRPRIHLISGKPKPCAMMAGLDSSFTAAILLGYHAKAGTPQAILDHTFHSKLFEVRINGVSYGEGGINSLYAGLHHRVPTMLATGDKAFCTEIQACLPGLTTVETKAALTATAAQCYPAASVLAQLGKQTQEALKANRWVMPAALDKPYTLEITLASTLDCDIVMTAPFYTRRDGRTVAMTTDCFETLYRALQTSYTMLAYSATFT